jgi:ribosome-associated protein
MHVRTLKKHVLSALEDAKGIDVSVLDVRKLTDFTDYMVIASGTSNRHVATLADKVVERLRAHGVRPVSVEGERLGEWVLIDYSDIVVHVMHPATRDFYNLEKLWGEAAPHARARYS